MKENLSLDHFFKEYQISTIKNVKDVENLDEFKERLVSLDWEFKKENTKILTHGIHVYPARMVPQMVRRLIKIFSKKDDVILDPFSGSGTVLLESIVADRDAIGTEINPLAVKISKVKTTNILSSKLRQILDNLIDEYHKKTSNTTVNFSDKKNEKWLNHWFKKYVQKDLYVLKSLISEISDANCREFFEIILSDTARNVSNNRNSSYKNYKMNEEDLQRYEPDILSEFIKRANQSIEGMSELNKVPITRSPIIINSNFLKATIPDDSVDFVLTSPPYGDSKTTVGYGQFSKFSMYWLDIDISSGTTVDNESLGGKVIDLDKIYSSTFYFIKNKIMQNEKKLKNNTRHIEFHYFYQEYQDAIKKISRTIRKNGYVCLVLGNRSMREIRVPMDQISVEIGEKFGLKHWLTIYRDIPSSRHPSKQKLYVDPKWNEIKELKIKPKEIENINKESIVILQKV